MDSLKSSYASSNYASSGYGGYSSGGYSSGGYSSGGYGSSNMGGGSGYSTQTKKNVVIKMIETKDGRVVSESSEVIED